MLHKVLFSVLFTWLVSSFGLEMQAQEVPVDPYQEFREPGDTAPAFGNEEDLAVSGYESAEVLYEQLTQPGRCVEKRSGRRAVPCALIRYPGGTFRPVFRVDGRKTLWTFLDTHLAEVSVDDLFGASDFFGPSGELRRYPPIEVVGFEENELECRVSGDACVDQKHFARFLEDRETLTMGCRSAIWGNQSDPYEKRLAASCRVYVPDN